jgi:hypothetical protein
MITVTRLAFTSFVAASTEAEAWVCPSSEATSFTDIFVSFSRLSEAFCMPTASFTARSRFAPYAASPPVNGRTSPTRRVNEQFFAATVLADDAAPTVLAEATAANATTATAATAALFLLLTSPPSFCNADRMDQSAPSP